MTRATTIRSLDTLVRLRSTEVEQLAADLASQEAMRVRFEINLERMAALLETSGASGAGAAPALALALNCGAYKQDVLRMADLHRQDLALHEANMAVAQQRLNQAWVRRELLGKVLAREQDAQALEYERRARKRDDDIANRSWMAARSSVAAA